MRTIDVLQAKREAYAEEMERNDNMVIIGEDLGPYGGMFGQTTGLWAKYGDDRVMSPALCESFIASFATGASMGGLTMLAELNMSEFAAYAYDALVNQAPKLRYMTGGQCSFPVVFNLVQGGGNGTGAHHSSCSEGWFQNCPGVKLYVPTYPDDYKGLLKYAIREPDPVIFIEHRLKAQKAEVPDEDYVIQPGVARVRKEGKDVTIVAWQWGLLKVEEAKEELAALGVDCEIIDPRTIKPLDKKTILSSIRKTGRLVVVTEAPKVGGVGNQILALAMEEAFADMKAPAVYVGGKDFPMPYGPGEKYVMPQKEDVIAAVKKVMNMA